MVTFSVKGCAGFKMDNSEPKNIGFDMKDAISDLYRKYGHGDSAHAFNSLLIWSKDMKISAYVRPGLYSAKLYDAGPNTWFFPVGSNEQKKAFIEDRLQEKGLVLRYMTPEDLDFVKESFPDTFEIEPAVSDSEYICDRNTIENLPGKGLSRKKRYVKQLVKEHTFRIKKLDKDTIPDVNYILDIWRRNKGFDPGCKDRNALEAMFENMDALGIFGIVLYMDEVPCSVMGGYLLSDDTVDCCVQKSVINEYGLQYYVRQCFSATVPELVRYYNFEEDLGIEGLRQAKEFMHPCKMIDMYIGIQK